LDVGKSLLPYFPQKVQAKNEGYFLKIIRVYSGQ